MPNLVPLLWLSDAVVFPGDAQAVTLEELPRGVLAGDLPSPEPRFVAAYRPLHGEVPSVGVLVRLLTWAPAPCGHTRAVLQGLERVTLRRIEDTPDGTMAHVAEAPEGDLTAAPRAPIERLTSQLRSMNPLDPGFSGGLDELIPMYGSDLCRITDLVASVLPLSLTERADLVAELSPLSRAEFLSDLLEVELIQRESAAERAPERFASTRSQPRRREDVKRLEAKLNKTRLPKQVRLWARREIEELGTLDPASPESARVRGHLEWVLELPWTPRGRRSASGRSFQKVIRRLDRSHVGLPQVKQRIAEFLAVRKLGGGARGTVLCFVGPPGTGKSSMGRSVAKALGRSFLTIPVGAMTHEREITGQSYKREGSTPGALLAGIHRSGSSDPVILLDEIDKLSLGGEGTSAGAFLQLLDPEHNAEFLDHYLGMPFNLSRCMLLATASEPEEIPEALLDRMEIIEFNGYTESEKYTIARRHLLPRALDHAGIRPNQLRITPSSLKSLIRSYTEEAGVRHLQRLLISLARKAAVQIVHDKQGLRVKKSDLLGLIGPHTVDEELRLRRPAVGVSTGLAWTSVGGSLLPIEAVSMAGSGRMILTGQVGEILRESVQTATSFIRTSAQRFGLQADVFDQVDLHLHFPSAATPKDGPSAGIAIAVALISLLTDRPSRHDLAMTGEISLLGTVLPVGGIREKFLAAARAGIPEVVVPGRNAQEILRLPLEIRQSLEVHLIGHVEEAIELALLPTVESQTALTAPAREQVARPRRTDRKRGKTGS